MSDIFEELFNQYKNFKNGLKGTSGEFFTELQIKYLLNEKTKLFRNAYVSGNGADYSQIDLIILHEKGIFVLECKNYGGWIFGSENGMNWTQMFSKTKKYSFYNPILQNKTHIASLAQHLKISDKCFVSYIVFGERCELKKVPEPTNNVKVINQYALVKTLTDDLATRPVFFNDYEINRLNNEFEKLCNTPKEIKDKHLSDVKTRYRGNSEKAKSGTSFLSGFLKF